MTEVLTSLCARRYGRPEGSEPGESRRPGARNDIGPAGLSQAGGGPGGGMSPQPVATHPPPARRHQIFPGAPTDRGDLRVARPPPGHYLFDLAAPPAPATAPT